MTHETTVPVNREHSRLAIDNGPESLREIVLHPHVVITRKEMYLNTLRMQLLQTGEQGDVSFRHHIAVFEPEIENVAQKEHMTQFSTLTLKQLHQSQFTFLTGSIRRDAEMRVRHEQTVAVQRNDLGVWFLIFHAAKIRFLGIEAIGSRGKAIGSRGKAISDKE